MINPSGTARRAHRSAATKLILRTAVCGLKKVRSEGDPENEASLRPAALAFSIAGAYSSRTSIDGADVRFRNQIRLDIGGALPRRASGSRPGFPCRLLGSGLALRLWQQFGRRTERQYLRQLSEL